MNLVEQDVEDQRAQGAGPDAQDGGDGHELPHRPIIRPLSCPVQTAPREREGYDRRTTIIPLSNSLGVGHDDRQGSRRPTTKYTVVYLRENIVSPQVIGEMYLASWSLSRFGEFSVTLDCKMVSNRSHPAAKW